MSICVMICTYFPYCFFSPTKNFKGTIFTGEFIEGILYGDSAGAISNQNERLQSHKDPIESASNYLIRPFMISCSIEGRIQQRAFALP